MKKELLGPYTNQYKANLHSHSTHSDGQYTPSEAKQLYKEHGYHILALSDHNVFVNHNDLTDENFLMINAVEIDISNGDPWPNYKTYHLNFFATKANIQQFISLEKKYDVNCVNEWITQAKENGFIAQYNHPRWSYQHLFDYVNLKNLWGFEVYNYGCEVENLNGWGEYEYESFCKNHLTEEHLNVTATDDNHNYHKGNDNPRSDSFGGFNYVLAKSLNYEDVMDALINGYTYASTGLQIYKLTQEDNVVFIETSPCSKIALLCDNRLTDLKFANDNSLTKATLHIPESAKFFRIVIQDTNHKKALTKSYKR